jgi:hypothetical protein
MIPPFSGYSADIYVYSDLNITNANDLVMCRVELKILV